MREEWRPIAGYEGLYEVSNLGSVRSLDRIVKSKGNGVAKIKGKRLKQIARTGDYLDVSLSKSGTHKIIRVHRLVAYAFCEKPIGCDQVNHKNEVRTDNRACNLEWCTSRYNNNYNDRPKRIGISLGMPVIGRSPNGDVVKFHSASEAERALGINNVTRCLKGHHGHHTAGGYRWEYA